MGRARQQGIATSMAPRDDRSALAMISLHSFNGYRAPARSRRLPSGALIDRRRLRYHLNWDAPIQNEIAVVVVAHCVPVKQSENSVVIKFETA